MRSGHFQSEDPHALRTIHGIVVQDATRLSIADFDAHNSFWSSPGISIEGERSWGSISAETVSRSVGRVSWRSDHHRIVYALSDFVGTVQSDNGPVHPSPLLRDNFSFRASGVTLESTVEVPVRFIQIVQRRDIYESIVAEMVRGGTVDLEPRTGLHDPLVSQIALTIANEVDHGLHDTILADALSTALAVRILRNYVDPSAIELAPSGGLSRERLQRVRDYIETHLDDRLSLTDLAGWPVLAPIISAARSSWRLGSVHTGTSCNAGSIVPRPCCDGVINLLLGSRRRRVFSDQSHLTSLFRRGVGVTPGRFRAASS